MINKKNIFYFLLIITTVVALISFQSFIIKVEAEGLPISVSTSSLGFGLVFPGEELEKEFVVSLVTGEAEEVEYRLTQTPKLGFLDLCPFLEKVNEEGEGDTESSATLSSISEPSDLSDSWKVVFKVPAILGFVAQEHIFGIISSGGDYGCDIGVEIIE